MSITAEKIVDQLFEQNAWPLYVGGLDQETHREDYVSFMEKVLSILQQGEPEGWARRPFDVRVHEKPIREITDAVFTDGWRKSEGASVQLQLEECFLAYLEKIFASPLPPATSWKTVDSAPEGKMLVTYRQGEQEISAACVIRENHRGEPQEIWAARDGRDTITHGSYAAPTHWLCECPPLPPAPGAETGEKKPKIDRDWCIEAAKREEAAGDPDCSVGTFLVPPSPEQEEYLDKVKTLGIEYDRSAIVSSSRQAVLEEADYFASLVSRARAAATKATTKFPQPNYVVLKIAEEAGEVVRGCVHYAEKRMDWSEVEGEIVQLLAMLIRLVTEGDQVNGVIPPLATTPPAEGETK